VVTDVSLLVDQGKIGGGLSTWYKLLCRPLGGHAHA
jgi:hypothetical protein